MYLFRETYDDLEANIIKEWKEKVPKELYSYNEGKHIAKLINGTTVKFRYIRSKQDADQYQGRSMDWIGVDELTKHEEESIQTLLSCLRSPKGYPPRFRGTCNPGSRGHAWVRSRYILATNYGEKMTSDPITDNRIAFIPAKVYDNDVLMKNDPAYVKRLENLPPDKKEAFLHGNWDNYEGMAFDEWNASIHVCKPFPIPKHWRRWMAVDNGYTDPFAYYYFAVSPDGQVFVYREYTRESRDPKVPYSDQAREAMRIATYVDFENGEQVLKTEKIDYVVVGADAFNSHPLSETGKTIVDYYNAGGLSGCIRAVTDRRLRKATIHEYLKPYMDENIGRMTSKVQIFSTCKKLVETLPLLTEDERDPEKVAENSALDHWFDAFGYGLIAHHANRSKDPTKPEGLISQYKNGLAKKRRFSVRRIS